MVIAARWTGPRMHPGPAWASLISANARSESMCAGTCVHTQEPHVAPILEISSQGVPSLRILAVRAPTPTGGAPYFAMFLA